MAREKMIRLTMTEYQAHAVAYALGSAIDNDVEGIRLFNGHRGRLVLAQAARERLHELLNPKPKPRRKRA